MLQNDRNLYTNVCQSFLKYIQHDKVFHRISRSLAAMGIIMDHSCSEVTEFRVLLTHSKNKVVKWTTLGLSNWCQKRTPQSRPKLFIWVSRLTTTLMSSQKQPENRPMTTFFTGFSVIWQLSYHLRTTEWQTSNRQMMVLWLICDKS